MLTADTICVKRPPPVNWRQIMLEILAHRVGGKRMTLDRLAGALEVPPGSVRNWYYGGSLPNFEDGRAMLLLHSFLKKVYIQTDISKAA